MREVVLAHLSSSYAGLEAASLARLVAPVLQLLNVHIIDGKTGKRRRGHDGFLDLPFVIKDRTGQPIPQSRSATGDGCTQCLSGSPPVPLRRQVLVMGNPSGRAGRACPVVAGHGERPNFPFRAPSHGQGGRRHSMPTSSQLPDGAQKQDSSFFPAAWIMLSERPIPGRCSSAFLRRPHGKDGGHPDRRLLHMGR